MIGLPRHGIVVRSILITLLAFLVASAGSIAYIGYTTGERAKQTIDTRLNQLLDTVQSTMMIACYLNDKDLAKEVALGLLSNSEVLRVIVSAGDSTLADETRARGSDLHAEAAPAVLERQMMSPFAPDQATGRVRLSPNPEVVTRLRDEEIMRVASQLAWQLAFVSVVIIASLIVFFVRPISRMSQALHRMDPTSGDRLAIPPGHARTEIGQLVRDVNELSAHLVAAIDESSKARRAAESASLDKSRFLAAASHDLRQPIQAISLFRDALGRTGLSDEQKRLSDYISQSIHSLDDILNALLDISKLDAGMVSPSPEWIRIDNLFARIDAAFSPLAAEKSLRFKLFFPVSDAAIRADSRLLMSLLGNLIGNAFKYTEQGGVLVGVRRRHKQAIIQIWDTGIGISPSHLVNIFDEYFQIGNPERDRAKGLGLGLSIAKRIAKLLGTEVVCRSRPGKGSVFEFCLPLAAEPPLKESARPAATRSALILDPAVRDIVVIEDDAQVARAIGLSLESKGMRVSIHANAEDALSAPGIADADFYISDFRLPGLNGIQVLDAIQQRSAKPIRAVVLTGDTTPDQADMTRSSPWTVLLKPVDEVELLSAIEAQRAP